MATQQTALRLRHGANRREPFSGVRKGLLRTRSDRRAYIMNSTFDQASWQNTPDSVIQVSSVHNTLWYNCIQVIRLGYSVHILFSREISH